MDTDNMTLEEFRDAVKKAKGPRKHKITNSFTTEDIYVHLRKSKWKGLPGPVSEHDFSSIIMSINKYLANNLIEGHEVKLPFRMGKLELVKHPPNTRIVDGELRSTLPIDWDKTLKLWYEDKAAFAAKTFVRHLETYIYQVLYNKHQADYVNKAFFMFRPMRSLKLGLKKAIKEGHLDVMGGACLYFNFRKHGKRDKFQEYKRPDGVLEGQ